MKKTLKNFSPFFLFILTVFSSIYTDAQTITGAWKGKIKNTKVELKLIRLGDSITGTSYYYKSKSDFRRYTIRGYFDPITNQVIWWDDILVGDKSTGIFTRPRSSNPLLSTADFNCPGENKMFLDGTACLRDERETEKGNVQLEKTHIVVFADEWDFVIENYHSGANDPQIIDSISNIALLRYPLSEERPVSTIIEPTKPMRSTATIPMQSTDSIPTQSTAIIPIQGTDTIPVQSTATIPVRSTDTIPIQGTDTIPAQSTATIPIRSTDTIRIRSIATIIEENITPQEVKVNIEQKFVDRKKSLATVIPITADSIELRFYDNAEIDGDSIALFLNNVLLFKNIRLTDQAYIIKLAALSLENDNELVMVAENLGSIPPNTSLMVVIVGDKRYEARLQSTENSSALIRFVKPGTVH
ncbi:MAG TPA: hypothetical protein VKA49_09795 [Flavitalea sp.]|nr:hypothetical protein [Flavitalea sp.]